MEYFDKNLGKTVSRNLDKWKGVLQALGLVPDIVSEGYQTLADSPNPLKTYGEAAWDMAKGAAAGVAKGAAPLLFESEREKMRTSTPAERMANMVNGAMALAMPLTLVGPKFEGWDALVGKFSNMKDKMMRAPISDKNAHLLRKNMVQFGPEKWATPDVIGDAMSAEKLPYPQYMSRTTLNDIFFHPKVFEGYKRMGRDIGHEYSLGDVPIDLIIDPTKYKEVTGVTRGPRFGISLRAENPYWAKRGILHEVMHLIQGEEGWPRGGNLMDSLRTPEAAAWTRNEANNFMKAYWETPDGLNTMQQILAMTGKDRDDAIKIVADSASEWAQQQYYRRLGGEIEARDVEENMRKTLGELLSTQPYASQNLPLDEWKTIIPQQPKNVPLPEYNLRNQQSGIRALLGLDEGVNMTTNEVKAIIQRNRQLGRPISEGIPSTALNAAIADAETARAVQGGGDLSSYMYNVLKGRKNEPPPITEYMPPFEAPTAPLPAAEPSPTIESLDNIVQQINALADEFARYLKH